MWKNAMTKGLLLGGLVLLGGCAAATTAGRPAGAAAAVGGGSCKTADACWSVVNPAGYPIGADCALVRGQFSPAPCASAGYVRRCRQDTKVTENGKTATVTYEYLYGPANKSVCVGTEEKL